jgi:hypothetical protein
MALEGKTPAQEAGIDLRGWNGMFKEAMKAK